MADAFGDASVTRLEGDDRYATSVAVAEWGVATAGRDWNWLGVATGEAFPDALSGALAPATEGSVMLLTRQGSLPDAVGVAIADNAAGIRHVFIFGWPVAVSEGVRNAIGALLP